MRGASEGKSKALHSPSNWPALVALTLVFHSVYSHGLVACKMCTHMTAAFMAARIERTSANREVPYCLPTPGLCPVPSRMAEVSSATLAVTIIILTLIVVVRWMR